MSKKFREVIRDIREGEVWTSINSFYNIKIEGTSTGVKISDEKSEGDCLTWFNDYWKFELQRKEYSFSEALEFYNNGKEIENKYSQNRYKKDSKMNMYKNDEYITSAKDSISFNEINSNWYIND